MTQNDRRAVFVVQMVLPDVNLNGALMKIKAIGALAGSRETPDGQTRTVPFEYGGVRFEAEATFSDVLTQDQARVFIRQLPD